MGRIWLGKSTMQAALERIDSIYSKGHRVVVSFSGGKDSTVCMELCVMVAKKRGMLPVEIVVQDEEVSYPGTYEFIEQTANRKDISCKWLVMRQPMLNIFNREVPYFWVMDDRLKPEEWVRTPPYFAEFTPDRAIETMVNSKRYPVEYEPPPMSDWDPNETRQMLVNVIGLRAQESSKRAMGIASAGGYITGGGKVGVAGALRPIYDWTDGDVWKFIKERKVPYNTAYDILLKMGVPGKKLRIGPPLLNAASVQALQIAARAWPHWFDRVCQRCPGARLAANFGGRVIKPYRKVGETWRDTFVRECIKDAPQWIADRATKVMERKLEAHSKHSSAPFPETEDCMSCGMMASWRTMAEDMWGGDPYSLHAGGLLPFVDPEFFRAGSGGWWDSMQKDFGRKVW